MKLGNKIRLVQRSANLTLAVMEGSDLAIDEKVIENIGLGTCNFWNL